MLFRSLPLLCTQMGGGFLQTLQMLCAAQDLLLEEQWEGQRAE